MSKRIDKWRTTIDRFGIEKTYQKYLDAGLITQKYIDIIEAYIAERQGFQASFSANRISDKAYGRRAKVSIYTIY